MPILKGSLTESLPSFADTLDDLNISSDPIYDAGIRGTLTGSLPPVSGFGIRGTEFADTLDDLNTSSDGIYDPGTDHTINALGGDDVVRIHNGNDTVNGGEGDDQIYDFGTGNDRMNGDAGDDTFYVGLGEDTVNGGTGTDTVSYAYSQTIVGLDLEGGLAISEGIDTLISIENAYGSAGNDSLLGSSVANTLVGLDGSDRIEGRGGDDLLRGDGGNDTIDGGEGNDTIEGGSGDDTIDGGNGADVVWAGLGHDTMTGGADADTFFFAGLSEGAADVITDFEQGVDKIDVSAIDARPDIAGHQSFKFDATPDGWWEEKTDGLNQIGNPLGPAYVGPPWDDGPEINGDPGEIEYRHEGGRTYVYLSPGDQYMNADIVLEGCITLTAADFIL